MKPERSAPTQVSSISKIATVFRTIVNWPLVGVAFMRHNSTVTYRTRSGLTFTCRTKSSDTKEVIAIAAGLEYDETLMRLPADGVVFDVGANIGAFAIMADSVNNDQAYVGYAFEPLPENVELLEQNLRHNNVTSFEVFQGVVGADDGKVLIDDSVAFNAVKITDAGNVEVASTRLSTFCNERSIDRVSLLKMDIEGAEYDVIRSDIAFINQRVDAVLLEFHRVANPTLYKEWIADQLSEHFNVRLLHETADNGVIYAHRQPS